MAYATRNTCGSRSSPPCCRTSPPTEFGENDPHESPKSLFPPASVPPVKGVVTPLVRLSRNFPVARKNVIPLSALVIQLPTASTSVPGENRIPIAAAAPVLVTVITSLFKTRTPAPLCTWSAQATSTPSAPSRPRPCAPSPGHHAPSPARRPPAGARHSAHQPPGAPTAPARL